MRALMLVTLATYLAVSWPLYSAPLADPAFLVTQAREVVTASSSTPEERIEAYIGLCHYLAPYSPLEGLANGRRALNELNSLAQLEQTGEVQAAMAECYLQLGMLDSVRYYLDQGQELAREFGNDRVSALFSLDRGAYYMAISELDSANECLVDALKYSASMEDIGLKSRLYFSIVCFQKGEVTEAVRLATSCHLQYWDRQDTLGMIFSHNSLGLSLLSLGLLDHALTEFDNALALIEHNGKGSLLHGKLLLNKAVVLKKQDRLPKAEGVLAEARATFEKHRATYWLTACLNNAGELSALQGDHAAAIEWYHQALESMPAHDRSLNRAIIEFNIRRNAVDIMYARRGIREPFWTRSDSIMINGRTFKLGECIEMCEGISAWLGNGTYRDFAVEITTCLNKAYLLIGDSSRVTESIVKIAGTMPKPTEAYAVIHIIDEWRIAVASLERQREYITEYRTITRHGLLIVPLLLLLIFLVGRSPGLLVIRVLFFVFVLFLATWVEMLIERPLRDLAGDSVGAYMALLLAVGSIFMLIHVHGSAMFHRYLAERSRKLKEKREQRTSKEDKQYRYGNVAAANAKPGSTIIPKPRTGKKGPRASGRNKKAPVRKKMTTAQRTAARRKSMAAKRRRNRRTT